MTSDDLSSAQRPACYCLHCVAPQSVGSVIGSVMEGRKEAERREREAEKSFQESDFLKGCGTLRV